MSTNYGATLGAGGKVGYSIYTPYGKRVAVNGSSSLTCTAPSRSRSGARQTGSGEDKTGNRILNRSWSSNGAWAMYVWGGYNFDFDMKNNVGQWASAAGLVNPAVNTWYHYVGTYDSATGQSKLYINGVLRYTGYTSAQNFLTNTSGIEFGDD